MKNRTYKMEFTKQHTVNTKIFHFTVFNHGNDTVSVRELFQSKIARPILNFGSEKSFLLLTECCLLSTKCFRAVYLSNFFNLHCYI